MKELSYEKMQNLNGGMDCDTIGGLTVGLAAGLIILGVATGGVGFAVAGGLAAYFGTGSVIYCAMVS